MTNMLNQPTGPPRLTKTKLLTIPALNKSNHLILALFITLLLGAATKGQALIISFDGVSDTATPIPGGTGTFLNFLGAPSLSAGNVAFVATGAGGQAGVYVLYPPGPAMPVADTSTAIPGGVGNFVSYPPSPIISGGNVVFVGNGSGGQAGVYAVLPPGPIMPGRHQHGNPRRRRHFR